MVYRLELHNGQLTTWHRAAGWLAFIPTGKDRFDTEARVAVAFSRDPASGSVTEMRLTGGRVRNLRFVRVALPATGPRH